MDDSRSQYTILEHTADLKLRARGENFPDTLTHLVGGLLDILFETAPQGSRKSQRLVIEAWDRQSLVVNFLNELLYLVEEDHIRPTGIRMIEVKDHGLTATLEWQKLQELPAYDIKAATYHDLVVEDDIIEVIFDL